MIRRLEVQSAAKRGHMPALKTHPFWARFGLNETEVQYIYVFINTL